MNTQLLDASTRERAIEVVIDIADDLRVLPEVVPARAFTRMNHAMLFMHIHQAGVRDVLDRANEALEHAIVAMQDEPPAFRLHGGLAGLGWTLNRLVDGEVADRICTRIDTYVDDCLHAPTWEHEYDLLRGLVGLGLYGLERLRHETGRRIVERVLHHLAASARRSDRGVAWFTTPAMLAQQERQAEFPDGLYSIGMSHGNAGVAAFLARCIVNEIDVALARELLDGCIRFVLSTSNPTTRGRFPVETDRQHRASSEPRRLAWCHGDMGITLALQAAATALDRDEWRREVEVLAHEMATRDVDLTRVVDAGLCHGAAGLGHAFHRLYRASGLRVCREAAREWFARALAMRTPARGFGGYQSTVLDLQTNTRIWHDDVTMLSGSAGIGLALLTAATEQEPWWDGLYMFDCGDWT